MCWSRRGSAQMVQGSMVSMLPQVEQTTTVSTATSIAFASGTSRSSFFLTRCSAARRAERGPKPGSLASSWIRRSISGPATERGMPVLERQLHAGRELEAAGQFAHALGECGLGVGARLVDGGDYEILKDLGFFRLEQGRIDGDALHLALAGHGDLDKATAGAAFDFQRGDLGLQLAHFLLKLLGLLHHAHEIAHCHRLLVLIHEIS